MSTVEDDGAIHVEGEYVGRIKGLSFVPDAAEGAEARILKAAALQAVAAEITARAKAVAVSADPDLKLTRDGQIIWNHASVGKLEAGATILKPRAAVEAGDQLSTDDREAVQARLQKFIDRHIAATLEPLIKLEEAEGFEGIARGLAFRMVETLGVLARDLVAEEVKSLSQDDRAKLRAHGIRFGALHLFIPALLKPAATELRLLLWGLHNKLDLAALSQPPGQGLTSAVFDRSTPRGFYGICGYRICGSRVVRIDMLERLADLIRERVFWRPRIPEEKRPAGSAEGGGFHIVPDMMSLVGCSGEDFQGILRSLDYKLQKKKVKKPVAAVPAVEPAPVEATPEPALEPVAEAPPTEPAPVMEEVEIEVWWPKDTGPFRRRPERKPEAPPAEAAKPEPKPRPERPKREERKPRREEPKPRYEKPIDPDSPFAVLQALKAKMQG